MFSIRSKVQNATPLPSYNNYNKDHEASYQKTQSKTKKKSKLKKKRIKKRRASEVVNINDYPSAKRRRISIIGVDVDPKTTKEIIQNKDFLLCEYHSNFPQFLVNALKNIPKNELYHNVSMKSCDNQWIVSKIISPNNKTQIVYWNTSSIYNHSNSNNNSNISPTNHPNSPSKCYIIENKCKIYDSDIAAEHKKVTIDIDDIDNIHLLYPSASSFSTLKAHKPHHNAPSHPTQSNLKYHNPFMPYALTKKKPQNNDIDIQCTDDSILCPLFPSSTSRSITSIAGVIFLSSDHTNLYVIPHDHVTTINNENGSNQITRGIHRNITYKIPLLTNTEHVNERITNTQILPQPRVGTHHSLNTYKILLSTSHGRLFYITLILNKNGSLSKAKNNDNIYFGGDGTDLSSKVLVKDHELLFAFDNGESPLLPNPNNVGWLGFVVSKIKIGANALSQVGANTPANQLQLLKSSGSRYDTSMGIASMCFGLNQNCTKIVGYTLRKQCIDCIEFGDKEYTLLWTFSFRQNNENIINPRDQTISISLLGQGLSILTGYVCPQYGHAITMTLFKINAGSGPPLIRYNQTMVQLPAHIHIEDLNALKYQSFWSYYYDKNAESDTEMEQDNGLRGLADLSFLQRQASMAEFVEQRQDERKLILQRQHYLVAPVGMIWSGEKQFITVFPLLCMEEKEDEIWTRIRDDYHELYPEMNLENTCGPDGDHFANNLVTTFEVPFYGGGCMLLPYFFTANQEKEEDIKQLSGGGYGYFMNEKYQIMRVKYSINSAMARIHSDIEYYQKQQKEAEGKRIKMNIRLAFSEYRNGNQGKPRAHRLSHKLINEKHNILSAQICVISESILNLKLFDTFSSSNIIQSTIKQIGFDTNKMRLGINQIYIKLQTYDDYIDFLKQSPCSEEGKNVWHFIHNQKKCDIIQHREYLQIAHELYNYFTNNQDDNDHYGQKQNENEAEHDSDDYDTNDEEEDDEECYTVDSRSSLSNFGDSNHNMYQQKYFCLKNVFVPKLLQCVIAKRGDIEYMNTFGNDENDTFFMKIGELQQILTELPTFLNVFLSHLTEKCCNKLNEEEPEEKYNIHFNGAIALSIKESNILIANEKDELVYQLITIRISLEIFQCIMNSAQQYRLKNKAFIQNIFDKFNRTLWNYTSYMRHISMQLCQIIVPFMHKISGLMSSVCSSSLGSARSYNGNAQVIDTDNNYYDYILKKEKNEIYRNLNEISRMIMESYQKELDLTQHQYQDSSAYDAINKNFQADRTYLIGNLYDLFPRNTSKQSLDRWKTDLVKDSVNKIAFDYGDCKYLVSLCDFATMNVNIQQAHQQENIFNICIQRFIDNLKQYKHQFMQFYFQQHQDTINSFLCIDIRRSEIWKTHKNNNDEAEDIDALLNECISIYINEHNDDNLSIIDEYSWIHNVSIGNYTQTATKLFKMTSDENLNCNQNNLDQQTVSLSIAKLSVFMDENKENENNIDCVQQELLWMNAKQLLRSYAPHKYENEKILKKMSKSNIVKNLIKESLSNHRQNHQQKGLNLQHMEQILSLIFNFEPYSNDIKDLNDNSLIVFFIENVINCNKKRWDTLDLMIEPKNRAQDTSMYQIINTTVIYDITKYLFNRKNQAKFLEKSHNIKMNVYQEDHLWELWSLGVNYSTTNKPDSKYYYAVRTLSFAQSPMT